MEEWKVSTVSISHEFNLPEDEYELKILLNANQMHCVIDDIKHYLRTIRKYAEKDPSFEEIDNRIMQIISTLPDF